MRIPNYKIVKESYESQKKAGRYNPGLELVTGKLRAPIAAGDGDDIEVRQEKDIIYVLCRNYSLGYIGLEVFLKQPQQINQLVFVGEVFLQDESDIEEVLGPKGIDYSTATCIRRLEQYT